LFLCSLFPDVVTALFKPCHQLALPLCPSPHRFTNMSQGSQSGSGYCEDQAGARGRLVGFNLVRGAGMITIADRSVMSATNLCPSMSGNPLFFYVHYFRARIHDVQERKNLSSEVKRKGYYQS
jgi:hypothetical protein